MNESLRAGELDRRITITGPPAGVDELGHPTGAATAVATVWAAFKPVRGSRIEGGNRELSQSFDAFQIRWRNDVNEGMSVTHDGATYEIDRVSEIGRRVGLELLCRKVR